MDIHDMLEMITELDPVEGYNSVEHIHKMNERETLGSRGLASKELEKYFEDMGPKFAKSDREFYELAVRKGFGESVEYLKRRFESAERKAACA